MNTTLEQTKQQSITIRVVFDGAPFAGKTTAAYALSEVLGASAVTPAQEDGRTVWFDWLTYAGGHHEGRAIRVELVTVPGQEELAERRRHLVEWGDVVVFIADTSAAAFDATVAKFDDLLRDLQSNPELPIVVIANKRDLEDALPLSFVRQRLGLGDDSVLVEGIATSGGGIREGFIYAVQAALASSSTRLEATTAESLLEEMQAAFPEASTPPESPGAAIDPFTGDVVAGAGVAALAMTVEDVAAPVEDVTPLEDVAAPVEDVVAPVEDVVAPVEDMVAPVEDVTPLEDVAAPVEDVVAPVEDVVAPVEDMVAPVEDVVAPLEDVAAPVEDVVAPLEDVAALVEDVDAPVEDVAAPFAPVEDVVAPLEDVVAPFEPLEDVAAPVEDVVAPVEDVVEPFEDVRAPVEDVVASETPAVENTDDAANVGEVDAELPPSPPAPVPAADGVAPDLDKAEELHEPVPVTLSAVRLNPAGIADDAAVVILAEHWRMLVDIANGRTDLPLADGSHDADVAIELATWGLILGDLVDASTAIDDPEDVRAVADQNDRYRELRDLRRTLRS